MSTQTLEQTRAKFAYKCVEKIANDSQDTIPKKKFKGLVKKTPTYILTNGLGNTLAFLFSKGNKEHLALAYIIGKYLFGKNPYTKNIFGDIDIFKEESDFFGYLEKLYKLNQQKSEFFKLKNDKIEERKIQELKEAFNNHFKEFKRSFDVFLSDELRKKDINIENFKPDVFINHLKDKMQNHIFRNLVFTDTEKYILATEETLRLLNWLKRFVEAMIEGEEE